MGDHRSRPRRRGPELEQAILQATVEELAEVGYSGLTIESVARRAGASKVSLYRRWPGRVHLVLDAAYLLVGEVELPREPSSLRQDLRAWLHGMAGQIAGPAGEAMRGVIAETLSAPDRARVADLSRGRSTATMHRVLERARARGEAVVDLTHVQQQVPAALLQHQMLSRRSVDPGFVDAVIDEVLLPMITHSR